jgi:hypothetical protein
LRLVQWTQNITAETATIYLVGGAGFQPAPGSKLAVYVFSDLGILIYSHVADFAALSATYRQVHYNDLGYWLLAFVIEPSGSKFSLHGSIIKQGAGMRYSLTEQLTGDISVSGKPIYQITYTGNLTTPTGDQTIGQSPANFENFIDIQGNIIRDDGAQFTIPYYNPTGQNYWWACIANATTVILQFTSGNTRSFKYWITIRYTKTTDQPVP